jgi:hypothetical protein
MMRPLANLSKSLCSRRKEIIRGKLFPADDFLHFGRIFQRVVHAALEFLPCFGSRALSVIRRLYFFKIGEDKANLIRVFRIFAAEHSLRFRTLVLYDGLPVARGQIENRQETGIEWFGCIFARRGRGFTRSHDKGWGPESQKTGNNKTGHFYF